MTGRLRTFGGWLLARRRRWLPILLLALGMFVINGVARLVAWKGGFVTDEEQLRIGVIGVTCVGIVLIGAAAWWAVSYPFGRLLADFGAAGGIGALLSVLVGPYLGGSKPFAEGLGFFVGQILLFVGLAGAGAMLGFLGVVAFGKDWKGRNLRLFEQSYRTRPRRPVRG